MALVEARDLVKRFGSLTAVDGISFAVDRGEVVGFLGPNGAGKSTAMRIISGFLEPTSGQAWIDGHDSHTDPIAARRRLGVLPDIRALYPRLTAREHLRYFGELHGLERSELDARIAELVATLRMEDFIDRRAKGFSRGQQMKVALGRALVHRPHNVMLDEPTNGLDVATSRAVRDLLRQLRAEGEEGAGVLGVDQHQRAAGVAVHVVLQMRARQVLSPLVGDQEEKHDCD